MHFHSLKEKVKTRREVLNVTQEQLAEITGVGLKTLKQFESRKENPTLQTLQKSANALGMEIRLEVKEL